MRVRPFNESGNWVPDMGTLMKQLERLNPHSDLTVGSPSKTPRSAMRFLRRALTVRRATRQARQFDKPQQYSELQERATP